MNTSEPSVEVATLALSIFDELPPKCKPRVHPGGQREWTPMSAIIVADESGLECVSLATGTKCLSASQIKKCNGLVLHDCHAETLAIRGFNRWLLNEIGWLIALPDRQSRYLERNTTEKTDSTGSSTDHHHYPFRIKDTVSLYMFTTTAPCGDASMDLLISSSADSTPWSTSTLSSAEPLGRGHFSLLGAMRRKPARGDAEPTACKSCTDKLALKQFTGLLAFPVDVLVETTRAAFLTGLVVYHDQFDEEGYRRAFGREGRLSVVSDVSGVFFRTLVLPVGVPRFEFERVAVDEYRNKATNVSAVWVRGCGGGQPVVEVLVNGVKQGYRQFDEQVRKASVLSRWHMVDSLMGIQELMEPGRWARDGYRPCSYSEWKGISVRLQRQSTKSRIVASLGGWVSNSDSDDFVIRPSDDEQ